MRYLISMLICLASLAGMASAAQAAGLTETGEDLRKDRESTTEIDGYLRSRGEALYNLDLDRGPTPSGQYFYPLPLGNPSSQWLTHGDLRLRTDLSFYPRGSKVGVHARIDVLDNLSVGSTPRGTPLTTTSQQAPTDYAFRIKRAYGQALTPVGILAVGRMGAHWGLGILANGGDCRDCNSGDAADRVAWMAPMLDHIFAFAFDVAYRGPTTGRSLEESNRWLDLDPSDNVRTATFAVTRMQSEWVRERRRRAGRTTVNYGAYVSHRWQNRDVPVDYYPTDEEVDLDPGQVMERGYRAIAVDGWVRVEHPKFRIEAEAAYLGARIEEPSLVPGLRLDEPITSRQFGAALESNFGPLDARFKAGFDAGFASGDEAPGFGANLSYSGEPPREGDLRGPQANVPNDIQVNNFRFHPDYRIDRILFHEIIGTVTDAAYARPHLSWVVGQAGPGTLTAQLAAPVSWAIQPNSAPGGQSPLGVELDPSLVYHNERGLLLAFDYAVLFPFEGLDNRVDDVPAKPAQLFKLSAIYQF